MNSVTAAALTILFLLIPHQEPRAGATPGVDAPATRSSQRAPVAAIAESDGFVWSVATSRDFATARIVPADHLATDGYSWSAGSDRRALDSTR